MEEPARSLPSARVSGVPSSRPSGPSESEMMRKLREFAQENPWANRLLANPELIAERLQGHDGAEDTPPAADINRDEHAISPPSAPAASRDPPTPPPTTELPPSTPNVAPTQPPASVTPPARRSSLQSSEHASENSPSVREIHRLRRGRSGRK